jgi:hypothetical protein
VSVILHDLANATQYLSILSSTLAEPAPGDEALLGGLSETTSEVDDIGFVLGLVAHAAGADVLHDRARRDGLDALLPFVRRALRREKREVRLDESTRSRVRIDTADRGRGATWAAARFVFAAGRALPEQGALTFEIDARREPGRLVCRVPRTAEFEACARRIAHDAPGSALELGDETCAFVFPAGALERSSAP